MRLFKTAAIAVAAVFHGCIARAQDLEPRAYSNSPNRHHPVKLYGITGYNAYREHDFQAVGIAWQYRWGGGF